EIALLHPRSSRAHRMSLRRESVTRSHPGWGLEAEHRFRDGESQPFSDRYEQPEHRERGTEEGDVPEEIPRLRLPLRAVLERPEAMEVQPGGDDEDGNHEGPQVRPDAERD